MRIVIDIPDAEYERIQAMDWKNGDRWYSCESVAIHNGTPLPKGHGRLIDADAFIKTMKDASKRQKYKEVLIDDCLTVDDVFDAVIESLQNEGLANGDTPTIIEADKGEHG